MAKLSIDFDAPDLAARAERASLFELDHLPFGVIRIARDGTVQFYSVTEGRLSGYGEIPLGRNPFEISNCLGSEAFRGRIERALDTGPVDLEIGWPGDFGASCAFACSHRAMAVCGCSSSATTRRSK